MIRKQMSYQARKHLPDHCSICYNGNTTLVADHIIPLSLGGSNALSNIRRVCIPCHQRVTAGLRFVRATKVDADGNILNKNTWRPKKGFF